MNNGFITIHRKILDWEWYDDLNVTRLFIHCLIRANHKDNKWRGILIKRGSFLTSISTLSKETSLSTSQIRTAIKKLKSTSEIASQSQAQYSVITMLKYDQYQSNDKVNDKPIANQSQASDKPMTTNNNVNNDNKVKDNGEFDLVWSLYGKKGNKKTSQLKFNKLSSPKKQLMARHLPEYVKSTPDKQYRKNMETYINQECWNDEVSTNEKTTTNQRNYETPTDRSRVATEKLLRKQRTHAENNPLI